MEKRNDLITFIGTEGVGKTTLCNFISGKLNGTTLIVPTWPHFQVFLEKRTAPGVAFLNQFEAMEGILRELNNLSKEDRMIFTDMCPSRVHKIHSQEMRANKLISEEEWDVLKEQYERVNSLWGNKYIYLRVSVNTLRKRLMLRRNAEDVIYNLEQLEQRILSWERLLHDTAWCHDKNILEINGELPIEDIGGEVLKWLKKCKE